MCECHVSLLIILSQFPFYQWWHYSLKQICSVEKETAFRSPGPSSCNLCRDIISFVESHSKTRCADQPYLIAQGCVCMCVCVHIRFHYKNRLPGSICAQCAGKLGKQGSPWPSVLLLPPASPSRVWRQEIRVRPQSEGHVAMVYTPVTSDLSSPPLHALSHHSLGPQTLSPESGPENKTAWPGPAWLGSAEPSPAQWTLRSEICLGDQWKTDGLCGKDWEEEEEKEEERKGVL